MSFLGKFKVDGNELNVQNYQMSIKQNTDSSGKVAANPTGGFIFLVIEADKDTSLFTWMTSPIQLKDGEITFFKRDQLAALRTVKFKSGYCVSYEEVFSSDNSTAMLISVTISAEVIEINGEKFKKNWPKSA